MVLRRQPTRRHDGKRQTVQRPARYGLVVAVMVSTLFAGLVAAAPAAVAHPARAYKVTIHLADTKIPAGDLVRMHGRISPKKHGRVTVQRLSKNGNWVKVKKVKLSGGKYATTVSFARPGSRVLRVLKRAGGGRKAGHSGIATLTVENAQWRQVSSGQYFGCGVKTDQTAWCWGNNSPNIGDLGDGNGAASDTPVQAGTARNWASVSAGGGFACGVQKTGTLWCWGMNSDGNLGNGTTGTVAESPVRVGTGTQWKAVSAANSGAAFACAVKTTGTAWCWGDDRFGELGDGATGTSSDSAVPVRVGTADTWTAISAGLYSACGLQRSGTAWCWGDNRDGQLGNGTSGATTGTDTPVQVGSASTWRNISAGSFFTCGVRTDGTGWCWGDDFYGELGDGVTGTSTDTPTGIGTGWTRISAGYFFACGIKTDASGYCWGYDVYGQLGDDSSGANTNEDQPTAIHNSHDWAGVSGGVDAGCGVDTDQTAWCWGRNDYGELGNGSSGSTHDSSVPVTVGGPLLHF